MGERKKANTNEQKRKCPQKLMKECRFLIREDTICIPCLLGWKQLALVLSSIHSSVLMLIFPTILSGDHRRHHNRNTLQVQNLCASRCDGTEGKRSCSTSYPRLRAGTFSTSLGLGILTESICSIRRKIWLAEQHHVRHVPRFGP